MFIFSTINTVKDDNITLVVNIRNYLLASEIILRYCNIFNLQWFGNLVTMEWWNDLWLNEGFASFMENVGVNHVHPEWKMMDQFFLDKFQVSSALDQLNNSHPIMAEVKDPAQINSLFDSISYDKVS